MRIGVFGNEDSWYVHELCRVGATRGHVLLPLLFDQFVAKVQTGRIEFSCGELDLSGLDAVLVHYASWLPGTGRGPNGYAGGTGGVRSADHQSTAALECAVDKYLTTQRLAMAGMPVPATIVCENSDAALEAFETLGRDVVIKPLFGAEGRGIMRVSDPELALRAFRTLERLEAVLYLQKFVTGPGFDVRILLLDGELVGSMKRFPKPGDFRANISQQGSGVAHSATDRELELARWAANVTGSLFAGVDLMYNAELEPVIIEVNAVPGWRGLQRTCNIDVPSRLFEWMER